MIMRTFNLFEKFLIITGTKVLSFLTELGRLSLFSIKCIKLSRYIFKRKNQLINQLWEAGVMSIPLVFIASMFTGMVAAVQSSYQLAGLIPGKVIGGAVGRAVIMELSPVLTALVLVGRAGASMTAEIGTMRVTEQLDALETLAIDPFEYVVIPRVIASLIILPILVFVSSIFAISGGSIIAKLISNIQFEVFFSGVSHFVHFRDIFAEMVKSAFFGWTLGIVGCYYGFYSLGGAAGVGKSTQKAVVISIIFILFIDFFLSIFFFGFLYPILF